MEKIKNCLPLGKLKIACYKTTYYDQKEINANLLLLTLVCRRTKQWPRCVVSLTVNEARRGNADSEKKKQPQSVTRVSYSNFHNRETQDIRYKTCTGLEPNPCQQAWSERGSVIALSGIVPEGSVHWYAVLKGQAAIITKQCSRYLEFS